MEDINKIIVSVSILSFNVIGKFRMTYLKKISILSLFAHFCLTISVDYYALTRQTDPKKSKHLGNIFFEIVELESFVVKTMQYRHWLMQSVADLGFL
jgi:hypothetical protein